MGEEAVETVIEACNGTDERLIYEGADLLYHLIVLLTYKGYRIEDLARELKERHSANWKSINYIWKNNRSLRIST